MESPAILKLSFGLFALLEVTCMDACGRALEIDLPANAIAYSTETKMLYATIPSSAGPDFGNKLIEINPADATITGSVLVGSEPGPLATSPDSPVAYVGVNSVAVRPVDLTSLAAGTQFSTPEYVQQIAVMPGAPATIAVTIGSYGRGSVAAFDSGIMRGVIDGFVPYANSIAFDTQSQALFGYNNYGPFVLSQYALGATGVALAQEAANVVRGYGATIVLADGIVYASSGQAVDESALTLIGTYQSSGPLVVDDSTDSVTFVHDTQLEVFDRDTFVPIFSLPIPGAQGNPVGAAGCGSDCIGVIFDSGQIFVMTQVSDPVFANGFDQ